MAHNGKRLYRAFFNKTWSLAVLYIYPHKTRMLKEKTLNCALRRLLARWRSTEISINLIQDLQPSSTKSNSSDGRYIYTYELILFKIIISYGVLHLIWKFTWSSFWSFNKWYQRLLRSCFILDQKILNEKI